MSILPNFSSQWFCGRRHLVGVLCFLILMVSVGATTARAYDWTKIFDTGYGGDANNLGTLYTHRFKNKLYTGPYNFNGVEMWRSDTGDTWTKMTGFSAASGLVDIIDMAEFGGYLYVAPSADGYTGQVAEISRSLDGEQWTKVVNNGFGNANNHAVISMEVFNNQLYASTYNDVTGLEIFRTSNGTDWTRVANGGFDTANNWMAIGQGGLGVYNGYLYAATDNPTTGTQVWRTANGTDWAKVSNNGYGIGSSCDYTSVFIEYAGKFYAFGQCTGGLTVRETTNGTDWTAKGARGLDDVTNIRAHSAVVVNGALCVATRNDVKGGRVYCTTDVVNWTPQSTFGIGKVKNVIGGLTIANGNFLLSYLNFAFTGGQLFKTAFTPLALSTNTTLGGAQFGGSYTTALSVTSGTSPYSYAATNALPPGLSLSSTGVIAGTPSQGGDYVINICATDSGIPAQSACQDFSLHVQQDGLSAARPPASTTDGSSAANPDCPSGWKYCISAGPQRHQSTTWINDEQGKGAQVYAGNDVDPHDLNITLRAINTTELSQLSPTIPLPESQGYSQQGSIFHLMIRSAFNGYDINRTQQAMTLSLPWQNISAGILLLHYSPSAHKWLRHNRPVVISHDGNALSTTTDRDGYYVLVAGNDHTSTSLINSTSSTSSAINHTDQVATPNAPLLSALSPTPAPARTKRCFLWWCW